MGNHERIYAEINLANLRHNVKVISKHIGTDKKMFAVIKANAYGHGATSCAEVLELEEAIYGYAVATAEEAMELIAFGVKKPILILSYVFPSYYEELIEHDIMLTCFDTETAIEIENAAKKLQKTAKVYVKIDTGMNRIGVKSSDALSFIKELLSYKNIQIEGMFTHFAKADEGQACESLLTAEYNPYTVPIHSTEAQFQAFYYLINELKENNISLAHITAANSAAILEYPATHLNLVRAGIILYGLWPSDLVKKSVDIRPVMTLKSTVSHVKTLRAGESISYGGTYITNQETIVATIPVGYADGYPRSLSNKGSVLIHGKKAPILGRVCMDQMMVDVTHIEGVKRGDSVTLIGTDGTEIITMEEFGNLAERFNYEAACDIGKRVPRVNIF